MSGFSIEPYYCLVAYYDGGDDDDGFSYCIMALHGYENFNLHPLAHVKYTYIYEAQQQHRKLWIVKRLRANTSIMPPFYSSPIYSNNNNLLHGWLILHGWTFFHPRNEIWKMLINSCIWMIYYMGILNLSLEFFFVGGMKCGKWSSKHYTIENHEWHGADEFSLEP